jgi:hypothetical protein
LVVVSRRYIALFASELMDSEWDVWCDAADASNFFAYVVSVVAEEVAGLRDHANCYFLEHVPGYEVDADFVAFGVVFDVCQFFGAVQKSVVDVSSIVVLRIMFHV